MGCCVPTLPHPVIPRVLEAGDLVSIDLVGPMPLSARGNRYLVTMHCHASRWPAAVPIPDATAGSAVRAFYYDWVVQYGLPVALLHDLGSNFTSWLFQLLLGVLGIEDLRTAAYHTD